MTAHTRLDNEFVLTLTTGAGRVIRKERCMDARHAAAVAIRIISARAVLNPGDVLIVTQFSESEEDQTQT